MYWYGQISKLLSTKTAKYWRVSVCLPSVFKNLKYPGFQHTHQKNIQVGGWTGLMGSNMWWQKETRLAGEHIIGIQIPYYNAPENYKMSLTYVTPINFLFLKKHKHMSKNTDKHTFTFSFSWSIQRN